MMLTIERKRVLAIGGLGHDLHLGDGGEQSNQSLTDDVVIVDDEQADGFGSEISGCGHRQHSRYRFHNTMFWLLRPL